jgi:selenocysteine lyase/cysteine desulfurase
VRFVSVVHLSNSLGTVNDVKRIASWPTRAARWS